MLLPAGARDNPTALVLIDDEVVGQASTCANAHVTEVTDDGPHNRRSPFSSTFTRRRLEPEPDPLLPPALRRGGE